MASTGYSDEELERTVYRHIDFVLSAIDDKVGGDPVKKAQLAKYVARKSNGATVAVEDKQATVETHTKELVATALKDYLSHVKQTYSGRYPVSFGGRCWECTSPNAGCNWEILGHQEGTTVLGQRPVGRVLRW